MPVDHNLHFSTTTTYYKLYVGYPYNFRWPSDSSEPLGPNWQADEPNRGHCVTMHTGVEKDKMGKWYTTPCFEKPHVLKNVDLSANWTTLNLNVFVLESK